MYGSILTMLILSLRASSTAAREAVRIPFPREETTPPVTKMNRVIDAPSCRNRVRDGGGAARARWVCTVAKRPRPHNVTVALRAGNCRGSRGKPSPVCASRVCRRRDDDGRRGCSRVERRARDPLHAPASATRGVPRRGTDARQHHELIVMHEQRIAVAFPRRDRCCLEEMFEVVGAAPTGEYHAITGAGGTYLTPLRAGRECAVPNEHCFQPTVPELEWLGERPLSRLERAHIGNEPEGTAVT